MKNENKMPPRPLFPVRNKQMSSEEKLEYYERLIKKHSDGSCFAIQYLNAQGNELSGKFFSSISSSRLAFELYSWLVDVEKIKNFSFEKILPGIKGSRSKPNMDVYFENENRIIFIESKFTEVAYNKSSDIPDAYFKEKGVAYSADKTKKLGSTLAERFYGNKEVAKIFSDFVNTVIDQCEFEKSWFDIKQEITHLFGIVQFILRNNVKGKRIEFYNIVYKNDDYSISNSTNTFIELAIAMVKAVKEVSNKQFNFIYDVKTIQRDVMPLIPDNQKAFGCECTVLEKLKQFKLSKDKRY